MSCPRFRAFVLWILIVPLALAGCGRPGEKEEAPQEPSSASDSGAPEAFVTLTADQVNAIKIEPVGTFSFPVEKEAVANISYDKTADPSTKWLVANVTEDDIPLMQVGQPVKAKVLAYPDRIFEGRISALGGSVWDSGGNPAIDPSVHTVIVRCEMADPKNELYPGMLASVTIQVEPPVKSIAIPMKGVVRNGDNTMAVWVTTDRKRFVQRIVQVGLQRDGQYQVLNGLQEGELVVTDGAVFLSNILFAPPSD